MRSRLHDRVQTGSYAPVLRREGVRSPMAPRMLTPDAMSNTKLPRIDDNNLDHVTGGAAQSSGAGWWSNLKQDVRDVYSTWRAFKDGWGTIPAADPPGHTKQR
jgi:hypothetical protein